MATSQSPAAELTAELRAHLDAHRRGRGLSDRTLEAVLSRTGDFDLALTALLMRPRPAWVLELNGND